MIKYSTIDHKDFRLLNIASEPDYFSAYLINFISILHEKPEAGSALLTRRAVFLISFRCLPYFYFIVCHHVRLNYVQ